jgi:hypothetical protein
MRTFIFLSFIVINNLFAQEFSPGYYIINSTAEYAVALPSGQDAYYNDEGCLQQFELEELQMNSNEIVIAYEFSKGKYYCFDPNGRLLVIQGANCLTKAPMLPGAGVGQIKETIMMIDGSELYKGSYVWIIGQNLANSSIKIQLSEGQTLDIPESKIELYGAIIKAVMKDQLYRTVNN